MYAGIYSDERMNTTTIQLKDKKLWIFNNENASLNMELLPIGKEKFFASGLPSPILFIKNSKGDVTGFVDFDMVPNTFKKNKQ